MPFEVKYHQMEEGWGEVTGSILFVKIWIRLHVLPPTAHLNFPEGKMSESALTVSFLDNFWRGKKIQRLDIMRSRTINQMDLNV